MTLPDQFVPHSIALAMRDMGYDEPCFGIYKPNLVFNTHSYNSYDHITNKDCLTLDWYKSSEIRKNSCLAPTWYQLHIWMAERLNDLKAPLFSNHTLNTKIAYDEKLAFIFNHFKANYGNTKP